MNLILQMILMELLLAAPGPSGVLVRGRALPVRGVQLYSVLTTFLCGVGFSQITTDIGTHTLATCNIETHARMHAFTCCKTQLLMRPNGFSFQFNSQVPRGSVAAALLPGLQPQRELQPGQHSGPFPLLRRRRLRVPR